VHLTGWTGAAAGVQAAWLGRRHRRGDVERQPSLRFGLAERHPHERLLCYADVDDQRRGGGDVGQDRRPIQIEVDHREDAAAQRLDALQFVVGEGQRASAEERLDRAELATPLERRRDAHDRDVGLGRRVDQPRVRADGVGRQALGVDLESARERQARRSGLGLMSRACAAD
jgi:hypothetical protein